MLAFVLLIGGQRRPAQQPAAPPIAAGAADAAAVAGRRAGRAGQEDRDKPAITVYMPPNTTGPMTAVIVAPGGSYHAPVDEPRRARAGQLLQLRSASPRSCCAIASARSITIRSSSATRSARSARCDRGRPSGTSRRIASASWVSRRAGTWRRAPRRNSTTATPTRPIRSIASSSRPDFAVLGYPVISFIEPWTHQGSKTNLLGEHPDPALARSLSSETQVTASTPPAFIYHTNADTTVPVENAVAYFLALRKAGVPAEMHIFTDGRARQRPRRSRIRRWRSGRGCWRTGCASAGS